MIGLKERETRDLEITAGAPSRYRTKPFDVADFAASELSKPAAHLHEQASLLDQGILDQLARVVRGLHPPTEGMKATSSLGATLPSSSEAYNQSTQSEEGEASVAIGGGLNTSRLAAPQTTHAVQPSSHMQAKRPATQLAAAGIDGTTTEAQRKADLDRRLAEEKARDESKAKRKKKDARGLF